MRPDLVIFDCDGVLVDSEPIALGVMHEVLAEAGCPVGAEEGFERWLGRSIGTIVEDLRARHGFELGADLRARMAERLRARFVAGLLPVEGVEAALGALGCPVCVASSSEPERLRHALGVTGLWARFAPHVFSASEVAHGKPAPDLFLHAAAMMETPPARCLVVEDSLAGIEAARAAGMRVLVFAGASHAGPARLAERAAALAPELSPNAIFSDMTELPAVIERLA